MTVHNILEPQPDYLDAALVTTFQIHIEEGPGDILVFLPGTNTLTMILGTDIPKRAGRDRDTKETHKRLRNDVGS